MPKPQPKTLPVTKVQVSKDDEEMIINVLFDYTDGAHFSLYAMPEPGEQGGPIMRVDDSKRLHSELLGRDYVGPGAQFAYLVHELGGPDHEPEGQVNLNLTGPRGGPFPSGHIV